MTSRRTFLATAAAAGAVTFLPFRLRAAGHSADTFDTINGSVTVHPIDHASIVLETPAGVIYVDPVGDVAMYDAMPAADLILVTHEHGDHYNIDTLTSLLGDDTALITNPAVFDMLPAEMQARATAMANGETARTGDISLEAVPAYNITEDRLNFHPQGRDNGYIVSVDELRIYISGDTEDTPEMRALENIDVAFVCMNLPFTMSKEAAASAVMEFAPKYVYPYHYRGRDNGTQNPEEFAELISGDIEVKIGNWYGGVMPS